MPPGRRTRRVDVPLVGRDDELGLLDGVVEAAVRRSRAATVVVVAEAGMGKTRLVEEVAERAAVRPRRRRPRGARASPTARPTCGGRSPRRCARASARPWAPPRRRRPPRLPRPRRASPCPSAEERRARPRRPTASSTSSARPARSEGIDPTRAREEVTRSLDHLPRGLGQAAAGRRASSPTSTGPTTPCSPSPTPSPSGPAGLPFVLLATARAVLLERWQPPIGRNNQLVLHLDPLDREAAAELLDHLAADVPDDLRELVLDRSGGNPFFLEELVSLLDEGGGRTGVPAHAARPRRRPARRPAAPRAAGRSTAPPSSAAASAASPSQMMVGEGRGPRAAARSTEALDGLVAKDLLGRRRRGHLRLPLRARPRGRLRHAHQGGADQGPLRRGPLDRDAPHRERRRHRPHGPPLRHRGHARRRARRRRRRAPTTSPTGPSRPSTGPSTSAAAAELHRVALRLADPGARAGRRRRPRRPTQRLRFLLARAKAAVAPARPRRRPRPTSLAATAARRRRPAIRVLSGRGARRAGRPRAEARRPRRRRRRSSTRPSPSSATPAPCARWPRRCSLARDRPHLRRRQRRRHRRARRGARRLPLPRRPAGRGLGAPEPGVGRRSPPAASPRPTPAATSRSPSSPSSATAAAWPGPSGMLAFVRYHQGRFEEAEALCERDPRRGRGPRRAVGDRR